MISRSEYADYFGFTQHFVFDIHKNRERHGMVKQKRYLRKRIALALSLAFSSLLLLAGCDTDKGLPFYLFEVNPKTVLTVDDVRYIEKTDVIRHPSYVSGLFWKFTGEIGEVIGVCGGDNAEQGGGFDVCRIEGDEEYNFLYVLPNHFVFGPYATYFCTREDLQITAPSAKTVSSVAIGYKDMENISAQVDDPAMIAALFEVFNGDSIQTLDGQDWVYGSLIMRHKDFPFLQCDMECCYSPEQEISYCKNKDREWFVLPAEWNTIISEYGFPAKDN
jgi:hypothetical protein